MENTTQASRKLRHDYTYVFPALVCGHERFKIITWRQKKSAVINEDDSQLGLNFAFLW